MSARREKPNYTPQRTRPFLPIYFDPSRVDELTEAEAIALHRALIREWPQLVQPSPSIEEGAARRHQEGRTT